MINCLIVDDEQHSIDVLTHFVNQCNQLNLLLATTDTVEALNLIATGRVDLLFQDVHMPDISGMEIVRLVNGKCNIVLTTAYKEYAIEGYELGVVDYLLKPISYTRFLKAVDKVAEKIDLTSKQNQVNDGNSFIYVKTGIKNSVIKINLEDIEYIESLKNYVAIFHNGVKTTAYLSLKELENSLPAQQFFRVHKSYIIPLRKIMSVEGTELILSFEKKKIPIGDNFKSSLWEIIRKKTLG